MAVTLSPDINMPRGCIRRGGGRYSIRKIIPVKLQPIYRKREIVRALGTSDPKLAKLRYAVELLKLETEFAKLLKEIGESQLPPVVDKIKDAHTFEQQILEGLALAEQEKRVSEENAFLLDWLKKAEEILAGDYYVDDYSLINARMQRSVLRGVLYGDPRVYIPTSHHLEPHLLHTRGDYPKRIAFLRCLHV
jgi:hypothetical protein